ncbi:MAG: hypothetical protein U0798_17760 [Gemmataceae bacterium]
MRTTVMALVVGLTTLNMFGCGEKKEQKTAMELKDVPAEILKVAQEKLPGVKFDAAFKEANGNFELRGKEKSGKTREIDIRPDGKVAELQ